MTAETEAHKPLAEIDFWFSIGSTYTYLSVMRLAEVAERSAVRFRWRPFDVRAIMVEMNNIPFSTKPVKAAYMWKDIGRRARSYGHPFDAQPPYPLKSLGVFCQRALCDPIQRSTMVKPCPFCSLDQGRVIGRGRYGVTIRDAYPVSNGHTLVLPERHIGSFFDLSAEEREDLMSLLEEAKAGLDRELSPQGYNVGINDGPAAGQTVPHLHIHLIPRYEGDSPDPRGGIRWILPEKADYWSKR